MQVYSRTLIPSITVFCSLFFFYLKTHVKVFLASGSSCVTVESNRFPRLTLTDDHVPRSGKISQDTQTEKGSVPGCVCTH